MTDDLISLLVRHLLRMGVSTGYTLDNHIGGGLQRGGVYVFNCNLFVAAGLIDHIVASAKNNRQTFSVIRKMDGGGFITQVSDEANPEPHNGFRDAIMHITDPPRDVTIIEGLRSVANGVQWANALQGRFTHTALVGFNDLFEGNYKLPTMWGHRASFIADLEEDDEDAILVKMQKNKFGPSDDVYKVYPLDSL